MPLLEITLKVLFDVVTHILIRDPLPVILRQQDRKVSLRSELESRPRHVPSSSSTWRLARPFQGFLDYFLADAKSLRHKLVEEGPDFMNQS